MGLLFKLGIAGAIGLCSTVLFTGEAAADLLYSNGGVSTGPLTESLVAAPAGTGWSEIQHDAGDLTTSNYLLGLPAVQGQSRLADDFTVAQGDVWTIQSIDTYSYKVGAPSTPSPFIGCTMQIWSGLPGLSSSAVIAGDDTTNRMTATVDTGLYRIFNTVVPAPGMPPVFNRIIWRNTVTFNPPVVLTAGTYWIDWASTDSAGTMHFDPSATVIGARTQPGWNALRFDGTWFSALDIGNPIIAPDVPLDFSFDIYGTKTMTLCGNGMISPPEMCDDGNSANGDGCDNNCTLTGCGNGIVTMGEACDDGNTTSGDGCDNNCTLTGCGNGIVTMGEACDDGNTTKGDGCDNNCTLTGCGNGVVTMGEACDDGNTTSGDGCDSNCTLTGCGNGIVTMGEACDDSNTTSGDGCDSNCTLTGCGNGIVTMGEACDDSNTTSGDGCSSTCMTENPTGTGGAGGTTGAGGSGAAGGGNATGAGGAPGGSGAASGSGAGGAAGANSTGMGGGIDPMGSGAAGTGGSGTSTTFTEQGGCGCKLAGDPPSSVPAFLLLIVAPAVRSLRRRSARRSQEQRRQA